MSSAESAAAPASRWRVLIADDEALARERLRQLIALDDRFEIVDESRNGTAAVDAILRSRPDLVFLDIHMPGLDGIEVAEAVADEGTVIVFVTAYDEFALRAFEVSALDYLLKPVDRERFERTLTRAAGQLARGATGTPDERLQELLDQVRPRESFRHRFLVRSPRGHYFVRAEDVEWVEAEGNYVALHASGRAHLVRHTMKAFEGQLDPARFVRVHRSTMVNADRIARIEPRGHGEYAIQLESGARVLTSRAYTARLQELLRR